MITKVESIGTDELEPKLRIRCEYDDGTQHISNIYHVFEGITVKRNKEVRETIVQLTSPAMNVVFKLTGEVNDYIKNDIKDCARIFDSIVKEGNWVSP